MDAPVPVGRLTGAQRLDLADKLGLGVWATTSPPPAPLASRLHGQIGAGDALSIGDGLHGVPSRAGEGDRNSRFFGCARSSASRRISLSRVFLPSSRCSSRTWYCRARYSEVGTTSSPAPTANSAPSAYSRRQVKSWFGATPCCRATSDTDIPGAKVSCTIRAFSSADQRRRRCTDVMTSTRSIFPVIDTGILLVLSQGVGPVRFFRGPLQWRAAPALTRAQQRSRGPPLTTTPCPVYRGQLHPPTDAEQAVCRRRP